MVTLRQRYATAKVIARKRPVRKHTAKKAQHVPPTPRSFPLVFVEWRDAISRNSRDWVTLDKMIYEPATALSVGFLIRKTKDFLVILPHIVYSDGEEMEGDGEIVIPLLWIKKIKHMQW